jgi:hypothetical protein
MTSYKSEQTYFAVHLHRILRSCPVSHYSRCGCSTDVSLHNITLLYLFRCPPTSWLRASPPTSWLRASSPSTASIVSCAAFAVSQSMPSCSTDVSLRHTSTIPRVSTVHTLPWPNQPLCTRLLFADCRPLHITQRYKSQGFVTSSRDATLPTRVITVSFP